MSVIDKKMPSAAPTPVESPLSMRELAAVLVKHYDLHDGKYDLLLEFQIGMGLVGPGPKALTPGAMIGISKIGLIKSTADGPTTVNAADINPAKKNIKK